VKITVHLINCERLPFNRSLIGQITKVAQRTKKNVQTKTVSNDVGTSLGSLLLTTDSKLSYDSKFQTVTVCALLLFWDFGAILSPLLTTYILKSCYLN